MTFQIKRVYDPASAGDGTRVLVDRLWPRGIKKSDAHVALWMKDVAPSPELRQWFSHDPERFPEFSRRYTSELKSNPALTELRKLGKDKRVTLLYGAHDPKVNHAQVLKSALAGTQPPTGNGTSSRRSLPKKKTSSRAAPKIRSGRTARGKIASTK
jgi:uncharacterized protein YeaO (DUF488 family)